MPEPSPVHFRERSGAKRCRRTSRGVHGFEPHGQPVTERVDGDACPVGAGSRHAPQRSAGKRATAVILPRKTRPRACFCERRRALEKRSVRSGLLQENLTQLDGAELAQARGRQRWQRRSRWLRVPAATADLRESARWRARRRARYLPDPVTRAAHPRLLLLQGPPHAEKRKRSTFIALIRG